MTIVTRIRRHIAAILGCAIMTVSSAANATVVEFQTVLGNFSVNLFDQTTPITVSNFLSYVNNGAYTNAIVHRSVANFVIQGGGFLYDGTLPLEDIPQNAMITNEPLLSNVRGTISMAKLGGNANSATNQWFINLADNSATLDGQNGGFTVFGIVMDNGMAVVDAIAALPKFDFAGPFTTLPLQNYTTTDFNNSVQLSANSLIIVNAVVMTDSTVDTGANLLPPANTTVSVAPPITLGGGGGGGGGVALWSLMVLSVLGLVRRFRIARTWA